MAVRRLQTRNYKLQTSQGFTIIEVLVATFVVGVVVTGMFGLFLMSLQSAHTGERRIVAVALANERMEMIRNLPYVDVGTQGGVPGGTILQTETITRNGQPYTVRTDIRYVDDPYDGAVNEPVVEDEEQVTICHRPGTPAEQTLVVKAPALDAHLAHGDTTGACGTGGSEGTGPGDEYNADYKQVRVEVSWPSQYAIKPVLLITYVAPQGIEGGELGGTLDFEVFNVAGEAVADATLTIVNDEVDPPINLTTQTNAEGRVVLPGLPASTESYELSVTKSGYTVEQTYDQTADFIPDVDHSHLSMIVREITEKTFVIDQEASVAVTTQDEAAVAIPNIAYSFLGSKTIGTDGSNEPVFLVDVARQTNGTGVDTMAALPWDSYDITIDGAATGYDIKETSAVLPLVVNPGDNVDLVITLVEHTPISLQVTVVDAAGQPIDNATVHLTHAASSYDQTLGTGIVGQVLFSDLPVNAEDYLVAVDAPGFEPAEQLVTVEDTSRVRVTMSASI